jgi:hypothetical protein
MKQLELETKKADTLLTIQTRQKTKPIRVAKKRKKNNMATAKDALHKIETHEKECALRYENIEKRLEEGSEKFKRLENLLWGVYPFIVGAIVVTRFL